MKRKPGPLRIRFYRPDDAAALFEAARESIADVYPWLPWCHPDYALHESEHWIREQCAHRRDGVAYEFAILDTGGGYLGGCGINCINSQDGIANLGYWVRSSATGRGVATKAVGLVSAWAFDNTDLKRLEIVCAVDNLRSQHVAERAGALREGVCRARLEFHGQRHDAVLYSISRPKYS